MNRHRSNLIRDPNHVTIAVAIVLHCATVSISNGAPPTVGSVDVPAFAETVRVSIGKEVLSLSDAIDKAAGDERLASYRQLRAEAGNSLLGQLELARWCRKQKLAEEERLHWRLVLMRQPGQPDAMKGLGLRAYDGRMLTKDQIAEAKKEAKLTKEAERKWTPELKQLKLALEEGDAAMRQAAIDELQAIGDPRVMKLVETMFADQPIAGLLIVEMYARDATQQSTDSLVRLAMHAKVAAVREKAAGELRYRPMEEYMPYLIGALTAPIEMSMRADREAGSPMIESYDGYTHTGRLVVGMYGVFRLRSKYTNKDVLFWAPEMKRISGSMVTGYRPDRHEVEYVLSWDSPDPDRPYEFRGGFEAAGAGDGREPASLQRSIAALEKRIAEVNAASAEMNERIDAAIREATEGTSTDQPAKVDNPADIRPRLWWDWWQKQLNLNNYFAKGTEVWTQLGIVPIEQVMVGDRVLTKNLDTGKLTYNLVIGIGEQPDREVKAVEVNGRTIVATIDQLFFVTDGNWRKASELKPGMQADTLAGSQRIESIRSGNATTTYSLLVADQPNYFVDRQGILVHDATQK